MLYKDFCPHCATEREFTHEWVKNEKPGEIIICLKCTVCRELYIYSLTRALVQQEKKQ